MPIPTGAKRPREAHEWKRDVSDHYVEPLWCSKRLFDEEKFSDSIWDPACGFQRITFNAYRAGYRRIWRSDIVERSAWGTLDFTADFLKLSQSADTPDNIITNPPFDLFRKFAYHALYMARGKVAMIWTVRTLPAARWLEDTPLRKVLLLTPRPSMPPGHVIEAGKKPGGGTSDFCWLVWECGFSGTPEISWLKRDGDEKATVTSPSNNS